MNIISECYYKTARSGGAGGQHVNKVETKVVIIFNLWESKILSKEQKEIIGVKLKNRISKEGLLQISAQTFKSQIKNKALANKKMIYLISNALKTKKARKKSKVPKSVIENRLKVKRINSERKQNRSKIKY